MITFRFQGEAELGLDVRSAFRQVEHNELCFAMLPANYYDLTIIGVLAQQGYNIAFDIAAKKIFFKRIDCQLLDE